MGQLSQELGTEPMKELQMLRDPPSEFMTAKLEEFKAIAAKQLSEAGPSVAKLEAESLATRASARFNNEQRTNVAALERRLRMMPVYDEGELSPESSAELSQARADLNAQIASLQNPTPEFKAQRIQELKAEIEAQQAAPASSTGLSSAAQIKLPQIA